MLHCADRVDQALSAAFSEVQTANLLGNLQPDARDFAAQAHQFLRLLATGNLLFGAQLLPFLQALLKKLANVLDTLDGPGAILIRLVLVTS